METDLVKPRGKLYAAFVYFQEDFDFSLLLLNEAFQVGGLLGLIAAILDTNTLRISNGLRPCERGLTRMGFLKETWRREVGTFRRSPNPAPFALYHESRRYPQMNNHDSKKCCFMPTYLVSCHLHTFSCWSTIGMRRSSWMDRCKPAGEYRQNEDFRKVGRLSSVDSLSIGNGENCHPEENHDVTRQPTQCSVTSFKEEESAWP